MDKLKIAPIKPLKPLDRDQRSFLEGALRSFERRFGRYNCESMKDAPKSVKRADKIVSRWLRARRKENERVSNRVDKRVHVIREEILFGDSRKALAMIQKATKEFSK